MGTKLLAWVVKLGLAVHGLPPHPADPRPRQAPPGNDARRSPRL